MGLDMAWVIYNLVQPSDPFCLDKMGTGIYRGHQLCPVQYGHQGMYLGPANMEANDCKQEVIEMTDRTLGYSNPRLLGKK